jgi:hypothetical protein
MTWIHPSRDSSRELMTPARVALGARLYADVVAWYGPVPTWLHGAAYRVVGFRLTTPLLLLIPSAFVTFLSLHLLARKAAGPAAALWGSAFAVSISLVAPNGGSLAFPYSFAAAHALALSSAGLALALSDRSSFALGAAVCWGLALAAKPEYPIAAMGAAFLATARGPAGRLAFPGRAARAAGAAALLALGLYAIAFAGIPLGSLRLEGPLVIFDPPAEWRHAYALISGWADPVDSLRSVATAAACILFLFGLAEAAHRATSRWPRAARAFALALTVLATGALALTETGAAWDRATPPLLRAAPLAALAGASILFARPEASGAGATARLALLAFAGLSSLRVLLFMTHGWIVTPYASLAAPALCAAAAAAAFHFLPGRGFFTGLAFAALTALQTARILSTTDPAFFARVETPRGTLRLPRDQAAAVDGALRFLEARARPGDALAAFPEGGLLNFALGLENPLREDQILPGHLDANAEAAAARRLSERKPRFVALLNEPTPLFGPAVFGRDYAAGLWKEVERSYRLRAVFGAGPGDTIGPGPYFVRMYERVD